MLEEVPLIVGIGEVLWDRFPDADRLGGAPANFAFHAGQLGGSARTVSRIGADAEAKRLLDVLHEHEVDTEYIQRDAEQPTGSVIVQLNNGQPTYEITSPAAWDFLEVTSDLEELAKLTDAVSFGTLAQRNVASRATIQQFIESVPEKALRLFDINLRQSFYSREIIEFGIAHASVLKLNDEELATLAQLFDCSSKPEAFFERMRVEFNLKGMALTLGENGCEIFYLNQRVHSIPPKTELKNAVGAGDAFAAALVIGLLRHDLLQYVADRANEVGAFVASQDGAMPRLPETLLTVL
jgi:fructokinase